MNFDKAGRSEAYEEYIRSLPWVTGEAVCLREINGTRAARDSLGPAGPVNLVRKTAYFKMVHEMKQCLGPRLFPNGLHMWSNLSVWLGAKGYWRRLQGFTCPSPRRMKIHLSDGFSFSFFSLAPIYVLAVKLQLLIALNLQNSLFVKDPIHQVYLAVVLTRVRTARVPKNPCREALSSPRLIFKVPRGSWRHDHID